MASNSAPRRHVNDGQSRLKQAFNQTWKHIQNIKNHVFGRVPSRNMGDQVLENGFLLNVMQRGREELSLFKKIDPIADGHQIECVNADDNLSVHSMEALNFHEKIGISPRRNSLPVILQLKPGGSFLAKFQINSVIENGKFGDIFNVKNIKSSKKFILKVYTDPSIDKIFQKINENRLHQFQKAIEKFPNFYARSYYLFSVHRETVGTLLLKNNNIGLPEKHVWLISQQMISAINFLHIHDIVHTCIDPSHIYFCDPTQEKINYLGNQYFMLKNPFIKLEMAISSLIKGNSPHGELISNVFYRAPEVMCGRSWDKAVDMWALGCVVFELYAGVRLGCNNPYTTFLVTNRCVGNPKTSFILWLQHSQRRGKDTYLIDALFEEIVPNETHYKLQKALMSFAALDVEKPFGNFLRQMINLDPHERAPIGLMLEHPYLRCPSIHLKKQFYAS